MLRRDADPALIERLVRRVADAIAPAPARLVYLRHADPGRAFQIAIERSGTPWLEGRIRASAGWPYVKARGLDGLDGLLAYWCAHGALCDAIVAGLAMDTLALDGESESWPARRERICAFLGVSADDTSTADPAAFRRLAGRYRDGDRDVTITLEVGRLVRSLYPRLEDT